MNTTIRADHVYGQCIKIQEELKNLITDPSLREQVDKVIQDGFRPLKNKCFGYMNIWGGRGDKVRYSNPEAGHHPIKELCLGEVYTVSKIEVGGSSSVVYLDGYSNGFNTVNFEDVEVDEKKAEARALVWNEKHGY